MVLRKWNGWIWGKYLFADDGKLRNAAILCFGKRPSRYFAAAEFKIGRFGASQSDLMFQDMVEGNLIQMADRVIDLLKSKYLTNPIHYEGLLRVEELEVPETALREAILNAIIHRDYTGAQIQMRVWNDRIELWNDGELPFGQTIESLKQTHSSKPRNRIIANVFYKAGFIESWGRGIDKICDGFTEKGFIEPVFAHNSGGVLCTLYRKKTADLFIGNKDVNVGGTSENHTENGTMVGTKNGTMDGSQKSSQKTSQPKLGSELGSRLGSELGSCAVIMTKNRRRIIELIQENYKISITQMAEKLEISTTAIEKNISFLKANGILIRIGNTNSGHWQIIAQN